MSICRKFPSCNAQQCPIDPSSLTSKYISGEPVCLWLLEYAKEGTRSELESAIGGIPIEEIAEAYEYLFASNGTIRGRLERASRTPSRLKRVVNEAIPQAVESSISNVSKEEMGRLVQ